MKRILAAAPLISLILIAGCEYQDQGNNIIEYKNGDGKLLKVPYYSQEEYPTGCELVSASMVLAYYGFDISAGRLISEGHIQTSAITEIYGVKYGLSPDKAFIGSPYDENSYGCYSGAIVNCLNSYLSDTEYKAYDVSGNDLSVLCRKYSDKGIPILVWVSINMQETYKDERNSWIIEDTGENFQWISREHCMVLIGNDDENFWFNDPYNGNGIVAYEKELAEERYNELGKQAVIVRNHY